jgi:hypothetical protein
MSGSVARAASWALRLMAVLAQTLYFKFTGAAESRWIFEQLGAEPWGRLALACVALCCALGVLWLRLPR